MMKEQKLSEGAVDAQGLATFAREWWAKKMPDTYIRIVQVKGDGRVCVHWSDHEESGKYTLPVTFMDEVLSGKATQPTPERDESADAQGGAS